jgi:hypothetical protein
MGATTRRPDVVAGKVCELCPAPATVLVGDEHVLGVESHGWEIIRRVDHYFCDAHERDPLEFRAPAAGRTGG